MSDEPELRLHIDRARDSARSDWPRPGVGPSRTNSTARGTPASKGPDWPFALLQATPPVGGRRRNVLQEFALKATQGARQLTNPGKIDAWLGIALRNALFDRYRRNASRTRLNEAMRSELPRSAGDDASEDLNRALQCLAGALDELRPEAAQLVRRAELQETPLKVIAREMQLTTNNIGVRVHRARAALREQMQARCSACSEPCALAARWRRAVDTAGQASISIISPCDAA